MSKLTSEKMAEYEEDAKGPGKFEGEARYVPFYWEVFLDGFADEDDGRVLKFVVSKEDKVSFPELKSRKVVRLIEREDGFVIEV